MTPRAQELIERMILEDEGGWTFTDRSDDAGGPTYGGMTWTTFNAWQQIAFGPHGDRYTLLTFRERAALSSIELREDIRQCYHDEFWIKGHVDEVPEFAQQMYFSACVNMGLKEALKCLQMAMNDDLFPDKKLLVDGHWGPKTAAMCKVFGASHIDEEYVETFKLDFSDAVICRYIRIVQQNARAWRNYALNAEKPGLPEYKQRPKVLQSENLMGWWSRARSYRSK